MECPICKNKLGFNCGICIECGYNYLNGKFEHIRVYVDDLKNIVPLDILEELIEEHKKFKKRWNGNYWDTEKKRKQEQPVGNNYSQVLLLRRNFYGRYYSIK